MVAKVCGSLATNTAPVCRTSAFCVDLYCGGGHFVLRVDFFSQLARDGVFVGSCAFENSLSLCGDVPLLCVSFGGGEWEHEVYETGSCVESL